MGVTVGICLYSILRFRPLSVGRWANSPAEVGDFRHNHALTPPWVQLPLTVTPPATVSAPARIIPLEPRLTPRAGAPPRAVSHAHRNAVSSEVAKVHLPSWPQPHMVDPAVQSHQKIISGQEVGSRNLSLSASLVPTPPLQQKSPDVPITPRAVPPPQRVVPPPAAVPASHDAQPAPTLFKAVGYVEKSDGQLEAIILQENQIKVVHLGDEISGRYRVTKITPEMVGAIDETLLQVPMAKPGTVTKSDESNAHGVLAADASGQVSPWHSPMGASQLEAPAGSVPGQIHVATSNGMENSNPQVDEAKGVVNALGYIQKSDGKVVAVVADGESVRLVPSTQTGPLLQPMPSGDEHEVNPSGLVPVAENSNAPVTIPQSLPDIVSPSVQQVASQTLTEGCSGCAPSASVAVSENLPDQTSTVVKNSAPGSLSIVVPPASEQVQDDQVTASVTPMTQQVHDGHGASSVASPATFIFQTLGSVEAADGEVQAIVADGSDTYLVRQGETFADQYQATSVDATLVVAVRVSPENSAPDFLTAQTDSGRNGASKRLGGLLQSSLEGGMGIIPTRIVGQNGHATIGTDLGVNLFNTLSTGLDVQLHFHTTDNPNLGY